MSSISHDMSTGKEARNLIIFSIPLFLSYLLQALYGSVDTIIVGKFASMGDIAGVTQGSQVMHVITQAVSGLSTGAVILISRYAGAGRDDEVKETVSTLFTVFACTALGLSALMLAFNGQLIRLIRLDNEAVKPMLGYLCICELGSIFILMYNCISAVLQAMGDSRHPLIFVGIACGVNVVLDLILVALLDMGAAGAALATVVSQCISVILSISFLRGRDFPFDFKLRSFTVFKDKLSLLLKLGIPYAVQRSVVAVSFLAISGLSNGFGLAAGSASGIAGKINNFATMPFTAISTAITTVAGQNMGAGRLDRSRRTLRIGIVISLTIGAFMFLIVQLFPQQCLGIFTDEAAILTVGALFLRYYSLEYLFMPFTYSINAFLAASGHTWMPLVNGLCAALVLRLPLAVICSRLIGFPGIALGSSIAVLGAVVSCCAFLRSGLWKRDFTGQKS